MIKKTKKTPRKKITKKRKSTFNPYSLVNILVAITILALGMTIYLYTQNQELKDTKTIQSLKLKETKKLLEEKEYQDKKAKYFEEKTKALEIEYATQIEHNIYIQKPKLLKKEIKTFHYDDKPIIKEKKELKPKIESKVEPKPVKKQTEVQKIVKPKLAIIIDDVTTGYQIKNIHDIGYTVNMAFLPPTPRHKNSAKITNKLSQYMIHLPLQASSNKYDEKNTLYIYSTLETIENRIKAVKKLYPKAKFLNNHTGSKFTSNQKAMDRLFQVLKKYNYTFIDSRTTAKSVASVSSKKYGVRLLSRNIFLDNKKDTKYIRKQLKKAIKIAKKHGSAIAIGHPYNITFKTLKNSKDLLKGIDLVFVNKL